MQVAMIVSADRENAEQMQAIDAKAVMALVQQSGGGMSLAMEEKILNIENNVMDIKEVINLLPLSVSFTLTTLSHSLVSHSQ
jgi:hypothetical protein